MEARTRVDVAPRVEDARADDLPAVAALESRVFDTPWNVDELAKELARPVSRLRVARLDGRVAGHLLSWHAGDSAEIIVTAVHPDLRRRGVARALLADLRARALEEAASTVFLEVRRSNSGARALYEGAGYVEVGCRPRYYGDGEDAIVMALPLDADGEETVADAQESHALRAAKDSVSG